MKQHPTSIAIPNETFTTIQDALYIAPLISIEIVHVLVFIGLLFFVFGNSWKIAKA